MKKSLLLLSIPGLILGCNGSSSSSTPASSSSSVSISGTLNDNTSASLVNALRIQQDLTKEEINEIVFGSFPVSRANDNIVCVSSEPPVVTYSTEVNNAGGFNLNVPRGISVGCQVVDGDDSSVKASFLISKTNGKDMRGNTQLMDRFALSTNANLGNISYDETGKATISQSTLGSALETETVTSPFDPTGTWSISNVDFTLPTGYSQLCPSGSQDCSGPANGDSIYVKRLNGYEWQNGARTGNTKYGIMVWSSLQSFQACGSKLGVTYADAKTFGGIDLSESGVAQGSYNWSTSVTASGTTYTISEGWKIAEATSNYEMRNCQMITVGTLPAWKCIDADGDYQVSIGGGCINTTTNEAVNVTNWGGGMNCIPEDLTGAFAGYKRYTCTATNFNHDNDAQTPPINVSCINTSGTFNSSDSAISQENFNWNSVTTFVNQGGLCSSIGNNTPAKELATLQCYSNAYWQYGVDRVSNACLPSIRTDYTAQDPNNFIISQNGPQQASNEYVFEQLDYKNNNAASFMMDEEYSKGTQVTSNGNSIWVNCRVAEKFSMSITKISTTKILADFTVETRLIDVKKSCKANESALGIGTFKSMFYMTAAK